MYALIVLMEDASDLDLPDHCARLFASEEAAWEFLAIRIANAQKHQRKPDGSFVGPSGVIVNEYDLVDHYRSGLGLSEWITIVPAESVPEK